MNHQAFEGAVSKMLDIMKGDGKNVKNL